MIFIVGYTASGKTTALEFFDKNNFFCIDLGKFWREYFGVVTSEDIIKNIDQNRSLNKNLFWDKLVLSDFVLNNLDNEVDIVISGIRSISDISSFKRIIGSRIPKTRNKVLILVLNVNKTIQTQRYLQRAGKEDRALLHDIANDNKYGISELTLIADYIIENNGSVKDLEMNLKDILGFEFKEIH